VAGFNHINKESIDAAFASVRRQYLVGELKLPQIVNAFPDNRIEVGISHYAAAASEEPHYHTQATEYQYMLSGMTEYLDLDSGETHIFRSGDFYSISQGTKYAQRVKQKTAILFIKTPAGNDKKVIAIDQNTRAWLDTPVRAKRIDHVDDISLKANSLRPAVAVAAFGSNHKILMVRRRDSGKWTMPGGTFEFGEDIPRCAKREFKEETGLDISIDGIIGTYSNPGHLIEYSDGEIRQEFSLLLSAKLLTGSISIDDESTEFAWVTPREALDLDMASSQRQRIEDVMRFSESGTVAVR
jgi:8-oxo-dGTP pyrophosphatase MutT (NUDIX family)/uncharacterized cupin superfamily protein